ncbi:hypothetical protein INT47_007278 [Mucor saturninus]|uniref:Uncharacterized protein n=1 Tax=Mucor saturninus TaxID=64648 RepID=A0A8H7R9M6_9FUNG|nr:hypothetical protein INT47_007278 [Mucor saturninus]
MSAPNYMDNVMSRFGHHLSAHQRTHISDSMVSNLQSAKSGSGYLQMHNSGIASNSLKNLSTNSPGLGGVGATPADDVLSKQ